MILTMLELKEMYKDYTNLSEKLAQEVRKGNLIKVARGLYETDRHTDGKYLADSICGPSYLSFEYVLSMYDLIPEGVFCFTSATTLKNRQRLYKNAWGNYSYRDVPLDAYPWGVTLNIEGGYSYQIATPEKALCDKLYIMPPVRSMKDISDMLFENLRIYEEDFWALSLNDILELAPLYRSNNLNCLASLIRRKTKQG
ncbi:MAG: hypothetical protein LUD47_06555 [Clostridia bacterium]|nr:hypothetical protein [Clostridia bacterium]